MKGTHLPFLLSSFHFYFFSRSTYRIHQKLKKADEYASYTVAARQLDSRMGIDAWKRATGSCSHLFDEKLIVKITKRLSLNRMAAQAEESSFLKKRELINEMIRILRQGGCKANVSAIYSFLYSLATWTMNIFTRRVISEQRRSFLHISKSYRNHLS
jgi:hypothetical protein